MGGTLTLRGHKISGGYAEAEAVVTKQPFSFFGSLEPKTGLVIRKNHELKGQKIAGKVFVFPYNYGSTSCGVILLEAVRYGTHPVALVNLETEPIISSAPHIAEEFYNIKIPIVDKLDRNPLEVIKTGDYVKVDGDKAIVQVIKNKY